MDQIFRYAYYPCRLVFSHEVKWLKGVDCFFIFIHGFEKLRNLYKYLKNTKSYRMDWEERLLVQFLSIYLFYFLSAIMVNGRDDLRVLDFHFLVRLLLRMLILNSLFVPCKN